jgi:hypothetical protein
MFEGTGTVIAVIGSVLLLLVILALAVAAWHAVWDSVRKSTQVKCNRCGEWHAHDPLHKGHPDVHVCVGDKT